ncbi:hypothetical protein [Parasitella parasitica]|uniref:Uncharacterized protein n=1 Tax=Parasitella parasitica TaxID=35722 RepID=A0A0B7NBR0_9FUNG|nr:hypothetical protein [Parasitella parasitica]
MLTFPIYTILVLATCICAIPVHQQQQQGQQHFEIDYHHHIPATKKIPLSFTGSYNNINALEAYYIKIVDQVINDTISEIMETAPETYLTIHELQFADYCRITLERFMAALQADLDYHIKYSLIASIRPLLEGYDNDDIIEYNQRISHQLGLLLDPQHLSHKIIQKVYHENQRNKNTGIMLKMWKLLTDQQWAQTVRHESNEAMAIEGWLRSWLLDVEYSLNDEFDAKIYSLPLSL